MTVDHGMFQVVGMTLDADRQVHRCFAHSAHLLSAHVSARHLGVTGGVSDIAYAQTYQSSIHPPDRELISIWGISLSLTIGGEKLYLTRIGRPM